MSGAKRISTGLYEYKRYTLEKDNETNQWVVTSPEGTVKRFPQKKNGMSYIDKETEKANTEATERLREKVKPSASAMKKGNKSLNELATPDEEDKEHLKGKPDGHIIGWNKRKYKIGVIYK